MRSLITPPTGIAALDLAFFVLLHFPPSPFPPEEMSRTSAGCFKYVFAVGLASGAELHVGAKIHRDRMWLALSSG